MSSRSRQCNKRDAIEPHKSPPDGLHWVAPILVAAVGLTSIVMVSALAMINLDNTTALVGLMAMEVPIAIVYVSGGSRFSMAVHLGLFALIAALSAQGGNQGLAVGAFGIMTYAVLAALHRIDWHGTV